MLNSKEFVRELQLRHESAWMNPNVGSADAALAALPLTRTDVDAEPGIYGKGRRYPGRGYDRNLQHQ